MWITGRERAKRAFAACVAKRGANDEPKGRASLPKDSRALGGAAGKARGEGSQAPTAVDVAIVTALVAIEGA